MTNHQRSRYQAVIPGSSIARKNKYRHLYRQRIPALEAFGHFSTFGDDHAHVDPKISLRVEYF